MNDRSSYTVEKKEETQKLGRGGEVQTYFRIWATSRGGTYFHIDVLEDQLEKASELLEAQAKKLDAI